METGEPAVFAHRCEWTGGHVAAVHNLRDEPCEVVLHLTPELHDGRSGLLGSTSWEPLDDGRVRVELGPYGYLWLRLRRPH